MGSSPTPAPPFMVQCWRKQSAAWFTDKRFDNLWAASAHAETLATQWDRKVRVIDQNEHVWLRRP